MTSFIFYHILIIVIIKLFIIFIVILLIFIRLKLWLSPFIFFNFKINHNNLKNHYQWNVNLFFCLLNLYYDIFHSPLMTVWLILRILLLIFVLNLYEFHFLVNYDLIFFLTLILFHPFINIRIFNTSLKVIFLDEFLLHHTKVSYNFNRIKKFTSYKLPTHDFLIELKLQYIFFLNLL